MPPPLLALLYKTLGHLTYFLTFFGSILAVEIDFRDQITLGTIILAGLMVIISGFFTVRSKIAQTWREEAEGEKAKAERLQEELNFVKLSKAQFEKEQQELRHDLKEQIGVLEAQKLLLESKTDLTAAINTIHDVAKAQHEGHEKTHKLLEEIRDKLPN